MYAFSSTCIFPFFVGTSFAAEDDEERFDFKRWANNQWHLFYDTWRVFAKKRKGHLRFFIITLTLINFVTALSGIEAVRKFTEFPADKLAISFTLTHTNNCV